MSFGGSRNLGAPFCCNLNGEAAGNCSMDCDCYLSENTVTDMLNYFRRPSIHQLLLDSADVIVTAPSAMSQSGYTLWGDVKLDDSKADKPGPFESDGRLV